MSMGHSRITSIQRFMTGEREQDVRTPPAEKPKPEKKISSPKFTLSVQPTPAPLWQSYAFPSITATVVTPFTNYFAVAKTHLQAKGSTYRGMGDFFRQAIAKEGVSSLQRGILPVALREASMNVFRIGLYPPFLNMIHDEDCPAPSWKRMVAGAWSGAVGFFACNPFEMVRVKMMAQPIGSPVSTYDMTTKIIKEEGLAGFYKAGSASVALGMVCTSVNLTSYTLFHEAAVEQYGETMAVDMSCALASGFLAALAMNPIDVIRTRLWTQPAASPIYRDGFHAGAEILKNEGIPAFFKGFVPSFLRIGPHFVLAFMLLEQMRRMAKTQNADQARDEFLTNIFTTIDEDNSGEIDKEELEEAINVTSPHYGREQARRLTKDIFDIADADHNGTIDLKEFLAAGRASKIDELLRGQQLLAIFNGLDTDGNGKIDEVEMSTAIRNVRKPPGPNASRSDLVKFEKQLRRDVRLIMTEIDEDGDGNIEFSEFASGFDKLLDLEEKRLLDECIHSSGVGLASA